MVKIALILALMSLFVYYNQKYHYRIEDDVVILHGGIRGGDFVTQNLLLFEPGYVLGTSGSKEQKGSTQGYYACNYFSEHF